MFGGQYIESYIMHRPTALTHREHRPTFFHIGLPSICIMGMNTRASMNIDRGEKWAANRALAQGEDRAHLGGNR